ncbi:MAG: hypothetical protein Q9162_000232 [Coniocarpon cinnabarinum]
MSTPGRRTRSMSRASGDSAGATPTPTRQQPPRAARGGSASSSGLAPRTSGAYGGASKAGTPDRASTREGRAGFAAGFNSQVQAARLSPVAEEPAAPPPAPEPEPTPAAEPAHPAPAPQALHADVGVQTTPVVVAGTAVANHGSWSESAWLRGVAVIMTVFTALAALNLALPWFGVDVRPSSRVPAGSAPAYERLFDRLYGDLHAALVPALAASSPPPSTMFAPSAQFLSGADVPDHNLVGLYYPDHFAHARGAAVNPELTSATRVESDQREEYKRLARLSHRWFNPLRWIDVPFLQSGSLPPVAALQPWQEAGECWCSAHAKGFEHKPPGSHKDLLQREEMDMEEQYFRARGGWVDPEGLSWPGGPRAQLAVLMPGEIYPTHAVIEHVPARATTDIKAAPEWIEFFAHVPNKEANAKVWETYARASGERVDDRPRPEYSDIEIGRYKNLITEREHVSGFRRIINFYTHWNNQEMPSAGEFPLNHQWVRVARYKYDIHGSHAQVVKIPVDFRELGIPIRSMTVRVRSNHGAPYTCLYRVRMFGEEV